MLQIDPTHARVLHNKNGRSVSLFLGLIAVFACSALLGFYVVGPKVAGPKSASLQPEPEQTFSAERTTGSQPNSRRHDDDPPAMSGLRVDINEPDPSRHRKPQPEAAPLQVGAVEAATDTESGTASGTDTQPETAKSTRNDRVTPSVEVIPERATTVVKKPSVKTESTAKADMYRVQVGVFSDSSRAQQVADQLKTMGQITQVRKSSLNGKEVYQVQAGLFRHKENADKLSQKLKEEGVENSVLGQTEEKKPE
ncbi:MAG: SPOR domain-containing protein [Armatimonadota bacterium]